MKHARSRTLTLAVGVVFVVIVVEEIGRRNCAKISGCVKSGQKDMRDGDVGGLYQGLFQVRKI